MKLKTIILAAGKGTRMKSELPKVIHKVCGKEMVNHVITASSKAGSAETVVVVGHGAEKVQKVLMDGTATVIQEQQLGTGHAVLMAEKYINDNDRILVLCGDTPLINVKTISDFVHFHEDNRYAVSVLSAHIENPEGYGRIVRDSSGEFLKIVEQKDASKEERRISEINSGIYCFEGKALKSALSSLSNKNAQGEYYLTDAIEIIRNQGMKAGACDSACEQEIMGVNDRVQLAKAEMIMRKRINEGHMVCGVTIIDPANTYIESDVEIGNDTIIYPGAIISSGSVVGKNCIIGSGCRIEESVIEDGASIQNSTMIKSKVGEGTSVGPYAYLRPNSIIGKNAKIGDFVEVKNSTFGDGSKASHLSYIGDADVGEGVNIGCGVVFVNYDGKNKFRTNVGDNAFIGCNVNLISPVNVGDNSYIAAGSTIDKDVPTDSFAIARERQTVKEGYVSSEKWKSKR